jgi:hypothetical protein
MHGVLNSHDELIKKFREKGEADVLARPRTHWSPIVDDETWQRVQAFIRGHQYHPHQGGRSLLVGFLRCSKCGSRMYTNATPQRPLRYRCSAHMRGAKARDDVVFVIVVGVDLRELDAPACGFVDIARALPTTPQAAQQHQVNDAI